MFQKRESYFRNFLASLPLLKNTSMKIMNKKTNNKTKDKK